MSGTRIVPAPRGLALAQIALGLGGLSMGTGEFAAMGLLPDMAQSAQVTVPQACSLISAYALGVMIGSPLLAVLTARMEKRRLLLLIVIVLVGNAASAFAPGFLGIAAARFLAGFPHGAYYGTASIVAAAMASPSQRAQAIGHVMLGPAAANLIGVPAATWLGQSFGWRAAFGAVAAGGGLLIFLLRWLLPTVEADEGASPMRELSAFASMQVWLTLAVATIGFGGMFAVYSYITPTLTQITQIEAGHVPLFLALWGLGMVAGNILGGWLADRSLIPAIFGILAWNLMFLAIFFVATEKPLAAGGFLFMIGANRALPDLFPHLWAKALDGERLLDAAFYRAGTFAPLIPPMRLLRLLMIQAGCERIPVDGERQGWTLDALVPGFDAALEQHGVTIQGVTSPFAQNCTAKPTHERLTFWSGSERGFCNGNRQIWRNTSRPTL